MSNTFTERLYWLAWAWHPKIGPITIAKLRAAFGSLAQAWSAKPTALSQAGLDQSLVSQLNDWRDHTNPTQLADQLERQHISFVTWLEPDYPLLLKEIFDPPPVLFYRGDLTVANRRCLSIVGSRHPSSYGQKVTTDLTQVAVQSGLVIVSGLAYGVDALAHLTCLKQNGLTIAVLAAGLDTIYPAANRQLAERILKQGGLILSEYPPGTPALKQHFPHRNRLIAGLSQGLLITEATTQSGSLITATQALDFNRQVCAVPGDIYSPLSAGCHQLIKQGAEPITQTQDLCRLFNLTPAPTIPLPNLTTAEQTLLQQLPLKALTLNEIINLTSDSADNLLALLTMLELKGYVKSDTGDRFARL